MLRHLFPRSSQAAANQGKERHTGRRSSRHRQRRQTHGLPGDLEAVSQEIQCRKAAVQIPLHLFLFDLIYLDGKSVIDLPLTERRAFWRRIADPSILADQVLSDRPEAAEKIYRQALEAGHEGLFSRIPLQSTLREREARTG